MIYQRILNDFLFFFYALFIFGSTFSIAIGQIGLGISVFLFLLVLLFTRKNPFPGQLKYLWWSILLYVGWMALGSFMGETPVKSLSIIKEEWLFVGVPIGVHLFGKERFRKKLVYAFTFGIFLISLYGILQFLTGVHWFKESPPYAYGSFGYAVKGFFAHRLTFGNYYATASLFVWGYLLFGWKQIEGKSRVLFISASIGSMLVTFLSFSYGPILAILIGLIFLLIIRFRKKAILSVGAVVVSGAVLFFAIPGLSDRASDKLRVELDSSNEASRIYIWENAVSLIQQHPVFGVGQGNFQTMFERNMPGHRLHVHAHNDFLNIGALGGIPSMLFFSFLWISLFLYYRQGITGKLVKEAEKPYIWAACCGSVVFLISSLTEATFADEEVRQMLMFVWSAGLWPVIKRESGTDTELTGKTS